MTSITSLAVQGTVDPATGSEADEQATARIQFGSYDSSAPGPRDTAFIKGRGRWVFAISLARW